MLNFARDHRGEVLSWAVVTLNFLEIVLVGGDRREVGLVFVCCQTALLSAMLVATLGAEGGLRLPKLAMFAGGGYAVLLIALFAQFLPISGGISAEAWRMAGAAPMVTLDKFATAVEISKLTGFAAQFTIALLLAIDKRNAEAALKAMIIEGAIYAAWALAGYYRRDYGVDLTHDHRLLASLPTSNVCGAFMGILSVLSWNEIMRAERRDRGRPSRGLRAILDWFRGRQAAYAAVIFLSMWDLALTGSRGAALATGSALILTTLVWSLSEDDPRGRLKSLTVDFRLLLLIGLPAAAIVTPLGDRFANWGAQTDRSYYFEQYTSYLSQIPLAGFGLGTFKHFHAMLIKPTPGFNAWELGAMHNVYLQWIYEAGPFLAILMFSVIALIIAGIVRGLGQRRSSRGLAAAAIGVSGLLAAHGAIDIDLQIPAIANLWSLLLGLALGLVSISRARKALDQ